MNVRAEPRIIVHGGAGNWIPDSKRLTQALSACREAAAVGQEVLAAGRSALDAVEAAVRILEDDPALDAGRGSYPNTAGQIEMDAMIMDGSTLNLGAVAAIKNIRNPISVARLVMTEIEHNLLVGAGAEEFAESLGIERCRLEDLIFMWSEVEPPESFDEEKRKGLIGEPTSDTVGAAALDTLGNLAAATSTGGTKNKHPGRVGDSPLVGSGTYADNLTAAVSATGDGESLMKIVISKMVCDLIASGASAQEACSRAIAVLGDRVKGSGGLIAVDYRGRIGAAFNTAAMPHAAAIGSEPIKVWIFSPLSY